MTLRGDKLDGIAPLANSLQKNSRAAGAGLASANGASFVLNSLGHGVLVQGPDISHVPAFAYTSTPISWATGLYAIPPAIAVAGMARTKAVIVTTISTIKNSTTATVASATGLVNGMQIADIEGAIQQLGAGTTFTIAGTTVTLSQAALATVTAVPVVAAAWSQP